MLPLPAMKDGHRQSHVRSAAVEPDEMSRLEPPNLSGVRAVVVDDDADARSLLERLLNARGATVVLARTAAEGLELVKQQRPTILISDIGMPNEDGLSLIRKVRSLPVTQGGMTPAIALTAFARADDRTRILVAGYQTHLAKPVEPSELLAVVASLARFGPTQDSVGS
jgi:CheY-like chemotaxis protein